MSTAILRPIGMMLITAVGLLGCADRADRPAEPRPITAEEASVLADLLVRNLEAGGAAVEGEMPYGPATFRFAGEIDWVNHVGRIELRTDLDTGDDPPPRAIVWNRSVVFEEVPGLADALTAQGRPAASWVARPLDPQAAPLHVLLQLIDTTSSDKRDNPVLLRSQGIRWLRRDSVTIGEDNIAVDVFENRRTTYWVGVKDRLLHRLDASLESTGTTGVLRFSDRRPRIVATPEDPEIVALDEVRDLYGSLLRG